MATKVQGRGGIYEVTAGRGETWLSLLRFLKSLGVKRNRDAVSQKENTKVVTHN